VLSQLVLHHTQPYLDKDALTFKLRQVLQSLPDIAEQLNTTINRYNNIQNNTNPEFSGSFEFSSIIYELNKL